VARVKLGSKEVQEAKEMAMCIRVLAEGGAMEEQAELEAKEETVVTEATLLLLHKESQQAL
jgi:hypothetical protein